MTVPQNPPDVSTNPWYQTTVVFNCKAGDQSISSIEKQFLSQFDTYTQFISRWELWRDKDGNVLPEPKRKWTNSDQSSIIVNPPAILLSIQNIRVWNLTGRAVSLTVFDYTHPQQSKNPEKNSPLIGIVDTGTPDTFPRCGFTMPASIKTFPVDTSSELASRKVCTVTSGSNDNLVMYVRISWKTTGPSRGFTFNLDPEQELIKNAKKHVSILSNLQSVAKDTNKMTKTLVDAQPSTLSKTIDGVLTLASYVTPLLMEQEEAVSSEFCRNFQHTLAEVTSSFESLELPFESSEHREVSFIPGHSKNET